MTSYQFFVGAGCYDASMTLQYVTRAFDSGHCAFPRDALPRGPLLNTQRRGPLGSCVGSEANGIQWCESNSACQLRGRFFSITCAHTDARTIGHVQTASVKRSKLDNKSMLKAAMKCQFNRSIQQDDCTWRNQCGDGGCVSSRPRRRAPRSRCLSNVGWVRGPSRRKSGAGLSAR